MSTTKIRLDAARSLPPLFLLALSLALTGVASAETRTGATTAWEIPEGAPTEPAPATGGTADATVADPMGDTIGIGMPQLDISGFSATTDGTNLILGLDFFTPISPADSGNPDAIVGFLDLDTDQDPMTGNPSVADVFCPQPAGIGVDYFVDLASYTGVSGQMAVIDDLGMLAGLADAVFSPMAVEVTVPLSVIGMDDGILDTATVIGTMPEPTDCAPNGGFLTSDLVGGGPSVLEIPTVGTWGLGLLALLLLAAAGWALRRRATA